MSYLYYHRHHSPIYYHQHHWSTGHCPIEGYGVSFFPSSLYIYIYMQLARRPPFLGECEAWILKDILNGFNYLCSWHQRRMIYEQWGRSAIYIKLNLEKIVKLYQSRRLIDDWLSRLPHVKRCTGNLPLINIYVPHATHHALTYNLMIIFRGAELLLGLGVPTPPEPRGAPPKNT